MKRWQLFLAAAGVLLLIGWGLREIGWLTRDSAAPTTGRPAHVKTIDLMDTPSGWRYRQNQPHHWRYIMLQN